MDSKEAKVCGQVLPNQNLTLRVPIVAFYLYFFCGKRMMVVSGGLLRGRGIGYWKCGCLALTQLPSVFKCCPQVTTMAISAWSFPSWKRPSPAWKPTRLLYTSVENASRRIFLWGGWIPRVFLFLFFKQFKGRPLSFPLYTRRQLKCWSFSEIQRGIRMLYCNSLFFWLSCLL